VTDLGIPDFLDRRKNGVETPAITEHRVRAKTMRSRLSVEDRIAQARTECERGAIRDRERERKAALKLKVKAGTPIHLNQKIENCPLTPGHHEVELVKLGYKWVRFRCEGKTKCVRVRRVIWDAIRKAAA
jgi:hypothetical protein